MPRSQVYSCLTFALFALLVLGLLAPNSIAAEAVGHPNAGARVLAQASNGAITLHASNAFPRGSNIRFEPQPHKNTIGYWTRADDWVSWEFELKQPGTFNVELTQACGKGSGGSEFRLAVGDQSLTDTVPDTGAFTNFIQRVIGTVKLAEPGRYTLSVKPVKKPGLAVMDLRTVTLKPRASR